MPRPAADVPETKEQAMAGLRRGVERPRASLSAATGHRDATRRVYGPERDAHTARLAVLDDIIGSPRRLHAATLCTAERFGHIPRRHAVRIRERGGRDALPG